MFGLAADREILRIYLQRRLFVAGAHAARTRHFGCLRATEIRDRKALGARAGGVARNGDDGLDTRSFVHLIIASEAKQSRVRVGSFWIASSLPLLAMTTT